LVYVYLLGGAVDAVIEAPGWLGAVAVAALHGAGLTCGLLAMRRRWSTQALLGAATVAGLLAQLITPFGGLSLLFMVVWIAPFRVSLVRAVVLLLVLVGGFVGTAAVDRLPSGAILGIVLGLVWAMLLAAMINHMSVTRAQTDAVAQARSNEAVLAERQRLAREIHDVLAHALSAQVVHLEGTRMLLEHGGDPAQVLARVIKAGDLARTGLDETKRAVEALRGNQAPLAEQIALLATEFRAATGRSCSVVISGDHERLPPETRLTVLRTAQEALTNVRKHAPEADVSVAVCDAEGWCELNVVDTGSTPVRPPASGGYGLVGMRERAELIGGQLEAGPLESGFRVRLRVPA
jgi:signal transduction histidine kinase